MYVYFCTQLSANVWRVHAVPGGGLLVLFVRGAVRLLDNVLTAPQQPIEEVLGQEENIRSVPSLLSSPAIGPGVTMLFLSRGV